MPRRGCPTRSRVVRANAEIRPILFRGPGLVDLPQELIDESISYLHDDREALIHISATHRRLRVSALRHLLEEVVITIKPARFKQLRRIIRASPALASYVHAITLRGENVGLPAYLQREDADLLHRFVRMRSLTLNHSRVESAPVLYHLLSGFLSLDSLCITGDGPIYGTAQFVASWMVEPTYPVMRPCLTNIDLEKMTHYTPHFFNWLGATRTKDLLQLLRIRWSGETDVKMSRLILSWGTLHLSEIRIAITKLGYDKRELYFKRLYRKES